MQRVIGPRPGSNCTNTSAPRLGCGHKPSTAPWCLFVHLVRRFGTSSGLGELSLDKYWSRVPEH